MTVRSIKWTSHFKTIQGILRWANLASRREWCRGVGGSSWRISFKSLRIINLIDVYYVFDQWKNLISVLRLINNGKIDINRNNLIIRKSVLFDNLYHFRTITPTVFKHRNKHKRYERWNTQNGSKQSHVQMILTLRSFGLDKIMRLFCGWSFTISVSRYRLANLI